MGLFSFLSTAKAADELVGAIPKVITSTISAFDKLVLTKEETLDFIKDLSKQLYDNFMPRAISRRIIATILVGLFAIFCLAGIVLVILKDVGAGSRLEALILLFTAMKVGWCTMTIVAFYFGIWPLGQKLLSGKK